MDKKLKAKWVKALTSGRYEQTTGRLYSRKSGAYCCLGVLCAVAGISKEVMWAYGFASSMDALQKVLPLDVEHYLVCLNDDGVPFDVIAGFINENL